MAKSSPDILTRILQRAQQPKPPRCRTCELPPALLGEINTVKSLFKDGKLKGVQKKHIYEEVQAAGYPYSSDSLFRHFEHE